MITITSATSVTDFKTIEKLADIIWREHYIPIVGKPQIDYMLEKFQTAEAISQQVANGMMYFALFFNKIPVGYIAIQIEEQTMFLSKIYVLKAYRGKGIAKSAMNFVENEAQKYNLKEIRLTVNVNNKEAIHAYSKLGFINKGSIIADIGNGFIMDDFDMRKPIH
ncbi:GNAT family N-acetyltransferase [Aestuariibaculum sediminum]|uniref:GNAT family N-acetyltransferase n=1 Tax=Aestuariibaculum sediminum TaxID=2770637 RepID=A0A8J6UC05_9FLAO|nr:GNAT family N-acetyltransferase [Aestuariibaculum sediminum]MBD0831764.1 GNAT family N-acetyltransferase [Aestuariibaculum sediminum]